MNVGIIGLGEIACKAYLPVITTRNVRLHLCSRNNDKLSEIGQQYRVTHLHRDLDSLLSTGIEAAFVHTATSSHEEVVRRLLENNVHVYVDKPVTDSYATTAALVSLARSRNLSLKAGFNRRYAPAYAQLKTVANTNMIVMEKNRKGLPGAIRTFVFDDFIHVVDTLLFLVNSAPGKLDIRSRISSGMLYHLAVTFTGANGITAIGIMNRDSGTTEERIEIFTPSGKRVVSNLSETVICKDRMETKLLTDDWQPMLRTRGFDNIIDDFLEAVQTGQSSSDDLLLTHEVCETIVSHLELRT